MSPSPRSSHSSHSAVAPNSADSQARIELTMAELRVAGFARACAELTLGIFTRAYPDDPRPAEALEAARAFAEGAPRSRRQRTAATAANRAAAEATSTAARHAAYAAGAAAGAAYLHPLATATQVRHILGAGAHAARAAEIAQGEDRVVAEYLVAGAASRATPVVRAVLARYPRAPQGRSRVAALMRALDSLLRDPAPPMRPASDPGPFFHGTRADVRVGDVLAPGWRSNYGSRRPAGHIYFTASAAGAPLLSHPRRAAGRRGGARVGPAAAGSGGAHPRADGRTGRVWDRGAGLTRSGLPPAQDPQRVQGDPARRHTGFFHLEPDPTAGWASH